MGTDITWCVEIQDEDGTWEKLEAERSSPRYSDFEDSKDWYEDCNAWLRENPWHYEGRNYDLFGILAGVRSHKYPQIVPLRGFPEDISSSVKEEMGYYDNGGGAFFGDGDDEKDRDNYVPSEHSITWILLKELLEYDWEPAMEDVGYFVNKIIPSLKEFCPWEVLEPMGEEEERLHRLRRTDLDAAEKYLTLTKRRGAERLYDKVRIVIGFG